MKIQTILITLLAPFENHIANGGEKLLGNASSIKQRPDGKVYVSGQMQRHVLFSAIDRLNNMDPDRGNTFVSNGDGITEKVEKDLRADMGGFLITSAGNYSGRRISPISATPAVALTESEIGRDLLVRLKINTEKDTKDQALATKEYSQGDMMLMNFSLDLKLLSTTALYTYDKESHVKTTFVKHVKEKERKRRARLFLEATSRMLDFAQQARNAVSGEPQQVLIVFDTHYSRKASRYFIAGEIERKNIIAELDSRNAKYFIGNDLEGHESVLAAYAKALAFLSESELYDPSGGDDNIKAYEDSFK